MVSSIRQAEMPDLPKKYGAHKQQIPRFAGESLNQVVLCSEVLGDEDFDFDVSNYVPWKVDPQLVAHVDALCDFHRDQSGQGARVYKGVMSRLVRFSRPPLGKLRMEFQPSSFFNYVSTNLSMECVPSGWTQTIRDKFEPGPELSELSSSKCSNHLGLDVLLVTGDGKLVIPERTAEVSVNPEMTAASASGAFEFEDVPTSVTGRWQPNPFRGILAEIREELAVEFDDVASLFCIGLSRELARGGKPQMFFYCESEVREKEIESRIKRGEGRDATFENKCRHYYQLSGLSPKEQRDRLVKIAQEAKASPPLKMALHLLHLNLDAVRSKGARMLQ